MLIKKHGDGYKALTATSVSFLAKSQAWSRDLPLSVKKVGGENWMVWPYNLLDDFMQGKVREGEYPAEALRRLLLSGEVTPKYLKEKVRNLGTGGINFLLQFLGLEQQETVVVKKKSD